MNVELNAKQLLKLRAIADESEVSIETLVESAVVSFLNKFKDADLMPLNAKAMAAVALIALGGRKQHRK